MSWIRRLRSSFQKRKLEDNLGDELQFHIEMRTQEFIRAGLTADEARLRALRLFGNQTLLKDRTRELWPRRIALWRAALTALRVLIPEIRQSLARNFVIPQI
jgi:hypothetical protein